MSIRLPLFLEHFSAAQDVSLLVYFISRGSSFYFLSGLFCVAYFFLLPAHVLRSTNHERTTGLLSYSSVLCLPTDFLLFGFTSSGPSITASFCFAPRFAVSSERPFLPRTSSRPSPAALFCFAPRFPLCCHWLPLVSRTSSRPSPAASFCFALRFPLCYHWLPFVSRTSSRPSPAPLFYFRRGFLYLPAEFLSFHAVVSGFSHVLSFVRRSDSHCVHANILLSSSPAALCCRTSTNKCMRMKPHACLLSR